MGLRFRLRGLAETFVESITCPACGTTSRDDSSFSTEHTRVSLNGIIVISECSSCGEIFCPSEQRCGIIDVHALRDAVEKDSAESGDPVLNGLDAARMHAQRLNAERKGDLH